MEDSDNLATSAARKRLAMLELQDCINKPVAFKHAFGEQFGITQLGIFGSVARQEKAEGSDIDIVVEVAPLSFTDV